MEQQTSAQSTTAVVYGLRTALVVVAVLAVTSASACKNSINRQSTGSGINTAFNDSGRGEGASGAPSQFYTPANAIFKVNYTSNTVRMDLPTLTRTLRSVSRDGRVIVFDASAPQMQGIAQDKVLLIEHVGPRRVLAVQNKGAQVALATQSAGFGDFIQDGHIEFTAPLDVHHDHAYVLAERRRAVASRSPRNWFRLPVVYADIGEACGSPGESRSGLALKGVVDHWEFEVEGEPEGDNVVFCLKAAKDLAGLSASVKIKGEGEHAISHFKADIQGRQTQNFEYEAPVEGKLDLNWAALTKGTGGGIGESRIKFPPFLKEVIDVYGLPFLVQANANLIFTPGFGTAHDAGEGSFEVTYSGSGGFSVHGGGAPQQEGQISTDFSLNKTSTESMAAHGVVVAIAAPKVTISIGTESFLEALKAVAPPGLASELAEEAESGSFFAKLFDNTKKNFFQIEAGAYVQSVMEYDYTSSGPLSVVPCTLAHASVYGEAGADGTLLALRAGSPHVEFLKKKQTVRSPDIPACGDKSE